MSVEEYIKVRWADAEPSQRYEILRPGGEWTPATIMAVKELRQGEPVVYVERTYEQR